MTKTIAVSDECHKTVKIAAAKAGIDITVYAEEKLCSK